MFKLCKGNVFAPSQSAADEKRPFERYLLTSPGPYGSYRRTCEIPCFHVFTIAKHVLGLIDRSGNREIKMWQCGKPPISPRSQRITNANCPNGSATAGRTVRAQCRSQRFTCVRLLRPQLRAREFQVSVQKNSHTISFSIHSVADSG